MEAKTNATNPKNRTSDVGDNEIILQKVQFISQNQEDGHDIGHFLKINSNDEGNKTLTVTADGNSDDSGAIWKAHFTLDENLEQVVILENSAFSTDEEKCVLGTKKDDSTGNYVLTVEKIGHIPTTLHNVDPAISFYKKFRCPGSDLVFFESALGTAEKRLLMGFDAGGKPLPLDSVEEFTRFQEAYFRVIAYRD